MKIRNEFMPADQSLEIVRRNWQAMPIDIEYCATPSGNNRFWWPRLHPFVMKQAQSFSSAADSRLDDGRATLDVVRAEYLAKLTELVAASERLIRAERERFIEHVVEPFYRQPIDRDKLAEKNPPTLAAHDGVMTWRPTPEYPGLIAFGDSRRGKTLSIFARLIRLHFDTGQKFYALRATYFKETILKLARQSWDEHEESEDAYIERSRRNPFHMLPDKDDTGERFMDKLRKIPLLFIDDIGQAKMSELYGEKLFELVEDRCSRRIPTLFTAQQTGAGLIQTLSGYEGQYLFRAEMLVGRLRDFCTSVDFGSNARLNRQKEAQ